jgi:hypothetical protein
MTGFINYCWSSFISRVEYEAPIQKIFYGNILSMYYQCWRDLWERIQPMQWGWWLGQNNTEIDMLKGDEVRLDEIDESGDFDQAYHDMNSEPTISRISWHWRKQNILLYSYYCQFMWSCVVYCLFAFYSLFYYSHCCLCLSIFSATLLLYSLFYSDFFISMLLEFYCHFRSQCVFILATEMKRSKIAQNCKIHQRTTKCKHVHVCE